MNDIGKLEKPFYCKKRDKKIINNFEIDSEFCNDCGFLNDENMKESECEVIRNAKLIFIDDDGNRISESDF